LYGFVIGIVSGADVAHGFPVLDLQLILLSSIIRSRRLIAFIMRRFRLDLLSNAD
jgi:hypothetical protein